MGGIVTAFTKSGPISWCSVPLRLSMVLRGSIQARLIVKGAPLLDRNPGLSPDIGVDPVGSSSQVWVAGGGHFS